MQKYSYEQLLEKIIRAKIELEHLRRRHSDRCRVELDPEGFAPCDCGADGVNATVNMAIKLLEL